MAHQLRLREKNTTIHMYLKIKVLQKQPREKVNFLELFGGPHNTPNYFSQTYSKINLS